MKTEDIRKELKSKERSLIDLHRYITTRSDSNPNYFLMLGSGCSLSSGIKTGKQLIDDWRKEVFYEFDENDNISFDKDKAIEFLSAKCGSWYNKANEYSSLFEKKYDLPRQRRMFVEKQVSGAEPSLGYAYLTALVEDLYFNTVFTTNFDDLLNEAFYQFTNLRPIVCAHDSSISSITITSKRPKIIKLHGDYLFDDIKSTLRETESLEENIKNKFIEFSKDYGVIVIGYSGCDRSIMDVMNYLLKQEDYLKNGIYWCIRERDEVSEELRKLLWKDKVYYVIINGFDEFFAYHYCKIKGQKLPFDTGYISSKSQSIVKRFVENDYLNNSKSDEIKLHLNELNNLSKMHSFQSILKGSGKSDYIDFEDNEYSDDELLKIFEIKQKINSKLYREAVELCKNFENKPIENNFKNEIYRYMITAYRCLNEYESVLEIYDKLISIDNNNPANYLNKAKYEEKYEEKYSLIETAMDKDAFFYGNFYEKAELLSKKYLAKYKDENENFNEILNLYDEGIKRSPNLDNPCWSGKFDFIIKSRIEKEKKLILLNNLISTLEDQNPYSYEVLKMKISLSDFEDKKVDEKLLNKIKQTKNNSTEKYQVYYDMLILEALANIGENLQIEEFINKLEAGKKYEKNIDFINLKAKIIAEKLCDLEKSISELERLIKIYLSKTAINRLISYKIYINDFASAENLIDKYSGELNKEDINEHRLNILDYKGDYKGAYHFFKKIIEDSLFPECHNDQLAYYLIKIEEYEQARRLTKAYLEEINFSKYAEVAIINYELSQVLIDGNRVANKKRLNDLYEFTGSVSTKAAIQALLKDNDKAFSYIKSGISHDYTNKFSYQRWPVFNSLRNDKRWQEIFSR